MGTLAFTNFTVTEERHIQRLTCFEPAVFVASGIRSFTCFMPYRIHVVTICISVTKTQKKREYNVTVPYAKCANTVCSTLI